MKYLKIIILIMIFLINNKNTFSQATDKKDFLNDYALCECLSGAYFKLGIKLKDGSGSYWSEASFLTLKQYFEFNDFMKNYVNKMSLNQGKADSNDVINYCLAIIDDKEFIKLRVKLIKANKNKLK